jgi:hypothetical protein
VVLVVGADLPSGGSRPTRRCPRTADVVGHAWATPGSRVGRSWVYPVWGNCTTSRRAGTHFSYMRPTSQGEIARRHHSPDSRRQALGEAKVPGGGGRRRPGGGYCSLGEQKVPGGGGRRGPGGRSCSLGEQKVPGGGERRRPGGGYCSLGEQKVPGGGERRRPGGGSCSLGEQKVPGGGERRRPGGGSCSLGEQKVPGGGGRRRPGGGSCSLGDSHCSALPWRETCGACAQIRAQILGAGSGYAWRLEVSHFHIRRLPPTPWLAHPDLVARSSRSRGSLSDPRAMSP